MKNRRKNWVDAKSAMTKAGVDIKKVFKKDLGPALDAFDEAESACEAAIAKSNSPRTDPVVKSARTKFKEAYNKAAPIGAEYLIDMGLLKSWADTPALKGAVEKTEGVLMGILDGMRVSLKRIGS